MQISLSEDITALAVLCLCTNASIQPDPASTTTKMLPNSSMWHQSMWSRSNGFDSGHYPRSFATLDRARQHNLHCATHLATVASIPGHQTANFSLFKVLCTPACTQWAVWNISLLKHWSTCMYRCVPRCNIESSTEKAWRTLLNGTSICWYLVT